jgi:hypothetical protein
MARTPGRAVADLRRLDTSNGCQDHTLLPSASASLVLRAGIAHERSPPATRFARNAAASTASHPNVRDDREARRDARIYKSDLPDGLSEIFFARRLDRNLRPLPVGQITWRKKIVKRLRRSHFLIPPEARPTGQPRQYRRNSDHNHILRDGSPVLTRSTNTKPTNSWSLSAKKQDAKKITTGEIELLQLVFRGERSQAHQKAFDSLYRLVGKLDILQSCPP